MIHNTTVYIMGYNQCITYAHTHARTHTDTRTLAETVQCKIFEWFGFLLFFIHMIRMIKKHFKYTQIIWHSLWCSHQNPHSIHGAVLLVCVCVCVCVCVDPLACVYARVCTTLSPQQWLLEQQLSIARAPITNRRMVSARWSRLISRTRSNQNKKIY